MPENPPVDEHAALADMIDTLDGALGAAGGSVTPEYSARTLAPASGDSPALVRVKVAHAFRFGKASFLSPSGRRSFTFPASAGHTVAAGTGGSWERSPQPPPALPSESVPEPQGRGSSRGAPGPLAAPSAAPSGPLAAPSAAPPSVEATPVLAAPPAQRRVRGKEQKGNFASATPAGSTAADPLPCPLPAASAAPPRRKRRAPASLSGGGPAVESKVSRARAPAVPSVAAMVASEHATRDATKPKGVAEPVEAAEPLALLDRLRREGCVQEVTLPSGWRGACRLSGGKTVFYLYPPGGSPALRSTNDVRRYAVEQAGATGQALKAAEREGGGGAQANVLPGGGGGGVIAWETTGHEWLGTRLARQFGRRCAFGTVTSWVPADEAEKDPPLWRVEHDDGDGEDLEQEEVEQAIALYQSRCGSSGSAASVSVSLPPGWVVEKRARRAGGTYNVYCGPGGARANSGPDAWRKHEQPAPSKPPSKPPAGARSGRPTGPAAVKRPAPAAAPAKPSSNRAPARPSLPAPAPAPAKGAQAAAPSEPPPAFPPSAAATRGEGGGGSGPRRSPPEERPSSRRRPGGTEEKVSEVPAPEIGDGCGYGGALRCQLHASSG